MAVAATLILGACTASVPGSGRSTTTGSATSTARSATTAGGAQTVRWHDCDDEPRQFRCATIEVPVDHGDPDGDTLHLALAMLPATQQPAKDGPLLVNPGGPGGSGIDLLTGATWPNALHRNFDIIGFDPRGVGASTPIDCGFSPGKLYSVDPAPPDAAAVAKLEAVSKAYVASCAEHVKALLPHMGTRDVARDMDDIRSALGVAKISYLGYSYGTSIGQVYADLFPKRIRAMVLDGVVRLGQPGIDAARDQGVAFDKVLGDFFRQCDADPSCKVGDGTEKAFTTIRAALRKQPMETDDGDRKLNIGQFQLGVGQALYAKFLWPRLAQGLAAALGGDGTELLALADQYLGRNPDGSYSNQTDVYFAVSCLDWDWPSDPQAFIQAGREAAATSPYLAEGTITDYLRCAYWPTPPQPLTPAKAKGSPLIVVVSTTSDPATPYANGVDLAKRLPHGALITKVGAEHTAYNQGNACVDGAVNAYLVSLKRPKSGLRCS